MDLSSSVQRGRPSNLALLCRICNTSIPYDAMQALDCCSNCDPAASIEMARGACESEDEGDNFVDAREELTSENGGDVDMADAEDDESATSESEQQISEGAEDEGERGEDEGDGGEETVLEPPEEEDLFASTFGGGMPDDASENGDDADGSDDEIQFVGSTSKQKDATTNSTNKHDMIGPQHTNGCKPGRGPSTPRDSPVPQQPAPPPPIDPSKDMGFAYRYAKRQHEKAIKLIPNLPLAEHRFWIGVQNIDQKYSSHEKHFTWMKGNRFSTVETVWNMYRNATGVENFVLLLGHEKVSFRDKAMELDYFDDKKIIFRALDRRDPEANGRPISDDIIPKNKVEVVDLVDD